MSFGFASRDTLNAISPFLLVNGRFYFTRRAAWQVIPVASGWPRTCPPVIGGQFCSWSVFSPGSRKKFSEHFLWLSFPIGSFSFLPLILEIQLDLYFGGLLFRWGFTPFPLFSTVLNIPRRSLAFYYACESLCCPHSCFFPPGLDFVP